MKTKKDLSEFIRMVNAASDTGKLNLNYYKYKDEFALVLLQQAKLQDKQK